MDFDPSLLRAFVAVVDTGGFTRAAQRLHLTQSAVSHQIRRLEAQVGRRLLVRSTRKLSLSEDGREFLRHAQQILQALDALSRRFDPSPVSGTVRFGAPENFMRERLPQLLGRFAQAYPQVRLEVSVSANLDLPAMLDADELDLAVLIAERANDTPSPGQLLRRARLVWVAAEGFVPPPGASLPFAFFPPPCVHRRVGLQALQQAGIDGHIVFTSHSQEGIHAAALAGLAITAIAEDDIEPGLLPVAERYALPPLPEVDFSLVWSERGRSPAAQSFGELIGEIARTAPESVYPRPAQRTARR
ncbi:LysR family transcriptional regulator [Lysobacter sp. BMK333-48F3]|uniref:LysR family transcriptional regulator n=1 Tax=Lysobacter sp. BMK333-48F3 TaxID=2867962 RepID=UPI001C8C6004|nr:LysR substrate-binding domain-containing protein [Lysobacter sp. BMK333-48F3]MBX9400518.1 LysR family transcriptional regulator [Lysobacter sp. BMK333-48F3]